MVSRRARLAILLAAAPHVGLAATLAAQAPPAPPAPGTRLPVVTHTLANGMTILALERRQSPTVALVVHFPVGSVNERLGNTGIAHVVEHMLFKGTDEIGVTDRAGEIPLLARIDSVRDEMVAAMGRPRRDTAAIRRLGAEVARLEDSARAHVVPNEFDRILASHGARGLNATTSHEATRYFVELPANRIELWFALEADRMSHPVFREFHTELDVVREERRLRLETSPGGILQAALLATAFQVHPYGVPVIGHAADLDALTRRQAVEYFRDYYGARNAVVAVVGDIEADRVLRLAEEHFGPVPAGRPPPPVVAREPMQRGERHITVEYDAEPRLLMGWRAVSILHEDAPALSMLASLLTAGRTHAPLSPADRRGPFRHLRRRPAGTGGAAPTPVHHLGRPPLPTHDRRDRGGDSGGVGGDSPRPPRPARPDAHPEPVPRRRVPQALVEPGACHADRRGAGVVRGLEGDLPALPDGWPR